MVLRSGIIIPFQYRDTKKLLMIGVPEENRDLSIWDLKNVVRAAFGIFNFEFRNKKIGFNIPDELLLHYLAQRHDLTNFVIEINQAHEDMHTKEFISFEPSCSMSNTLKQQQQQHQQNHESHVPLPQKSNGSGSVNDYATNHSDSNNLTPIAADATTPQPHSPTPTARREHLGSPMQHTNQSDDLRDSADDSQKPRILHVYSEHMPESLTQAIDPSAVIPKSELAEQHAREERYQSRQQQLHMQQRHQALPQSQQLATHHMATQQFFPNYTQLLSSAPNTPLSSGAPPPTQQSPYTPGMMNRFRKRGERMSKDQKELYVKFFEENPTMLSNRRNDALLEPLWCKLAALLNSVPQGAVKNVEEWKQTFDAWRYRIFMYTRYNSKLSGADAQDPKNYKPLTTTDQRAYAMWTSHKHPTPQDYEKMEMFGNFEETTTAHTDYDY